MATNPPKDGAKGYSYRRRLVIPVVVIMVVTIIVGFALHIAATVSNSWGRTKDVAEFNWGFRETCNVINSQEEDPNEPGTYINVRRVQCHPIGEGDCGFYNDYYFGDPATCSSDPEHPAEALDSIAKTLKTAKALSGVATFFTITPLPFVFMAFFKELRWGIYSMPLYVLWFIFWVATITTFNKSCTHILTYQPPFGGFQFAEGTSAQALYDSGAFLHIGAFVSMAVSCLSFWASYLACFQVDVYDADGNIVPVEELLAKRQAAGTGNSVSTQDLVAKP